MKKIMIAAAIVCAAALGQAATFDWTSSGKVYVADVTLSSLTDGQVITALSSGTKGYMDSSNFTAVNWAAKMILSDGANSETLDITPAFTSHKLKVTDVNSTVFALPTDESTTKTYQWTIVLTGTWTDDKGKEWTMTSNEITGSANYSNLSAAQINSGVPSSWTVKGPGSEDVPEPTSALLMLLGVAGLALRRKQA